MVLSAFPSPNGAAKPSVLAAAASGIGTFIKAEGCDPDALSISVGMPARDGLPPTAALDLGSYCALFEEAARQSGRSDIGLRYGYQFLPDSLGLIGFLALASPTIGGALENLADFFIYHQRDTTTRFVRSAPGYRLEYLIRDSRIRRRAQDAELTMGMFCNVVRHVLGPRWAPRAIWLEHPRQARVADYDTAFGAPVHFGRETNAIFFDADIMDCPMPTANARLFNVLRDSLVALDHVPMTRDRGNDLPEQVRHVIRQTLPDDVPRLDMMADRLKVARWTLQRRLDTLGMTYSGLIDDVRRELAIDYLARRALPVSEIAFLLGYSEISAFSRAFRKWTGFSPRAFRDANCQLPVSN